MIDNALASSADKAHLLLRPQAFGAIFYGGLAVGLLDGTAAVITTIIYGRSPWRMFQTIASGLIGRGSLEGGWPTVLLGMALHVLIAYIWATIYYGASLRFPALIHQALICGPIYGVVVYYAMQIIVLPLSAIRAYPVGGPPEGLRLSPFGFAANPKGMLIGIITHIICVGTPIALMAWRAAKTNKLNV
jgi:hypothetical protein